MAFGWLSQVLGPFYTDYVEASYELWSKLLTGAYIGDYMGDYYRGH